MLKTTKEFDFVYKNSYKFRTEMLDICVLKPNLTEQFFARFRRLPCNLVGFSVSKKVGIAVERNLIKRRLRAICRDFFGKRNSSLGAPCGDLANFGRSQTLSLVSRPKFAKNSTTSTTNTRIVDSNADSADSSLRENERSEFSWQSTKNQSRVSATESRPIRGAKNRIQGCSSATADFLPESEKRGTPPKSEKAAAFWRVGGAGRGVQPFLRKETSEFNGMDCHDSAFAESRNDGICADCFGDESPRNDNMGQNLICIFIAKSQILQTPFSALKSTIFATLKKQMRFMKNSHSAPKMANRYESPKRESNKIANRPQTKAKQNENR